MARVRVRFFATVREAAGVAGCEADAEDLASLLSELGRRFGPALSSALRMYSEEPDRLVVLVNGRNARQSAGAPVRLADGDDIAVFPPVSGG